MKKYLCYRCGHELSIDDNFYGSEIGIVAPENAETEEDLVVTLMKCPNCGLFYEVYDVPESERKNYPYFEGK